MITALSLALAVTLPGPVTPAPCVALVTPSAFASDSLQLLFEQGVTYQEFLASAERRVEQWQANTASAEALDATLVARAREVGGTWRLLVVAIDSCSDSVNIVPWLARLADEVDGIELRIIDPTVGKGVMEAHRTPDDRAATPTVLLLDDQWQERGCLVERPVALRQHLDSLPSDGRTRARMAWYESDAGQSTVDQVVTMLEAAATGTVRCE